jgi:hypothetical protein
VSLLWSTVNWKDKDGTGGKVGKAVLDGGSRGRGEFKANGKGDDKAAARGENKSTVDDGWGNISSGSAVGRPPTVK